MKIGLLYATETGNSEMLCDDIETELGTGFDCDIQNMGEVDPADLDTDTLYIFVTSTYGNGDLPSTATSFFDALNEHKPDLSGIRFAMFGLGDRVFDETFNQGSERLAASLKECKAEMIGERGLHDASSGEMPEDIALPWIRTIMSEVTAEAA
ncbi:MAG: flavodoxin domain-containing protein [Pseudomonadota bacterium]